MLDQRRLGGLDVLMGHGLAPPSACGPAVSLAPWPSMLRLWPERLWAWQRACLRWRLVVCRGFRRDVSARPLPLAAPCAAWLGLGSMIGLSIGAWRSTMVVRAAHAVDRLRTSSISRLAHRVLELALEVGGRAAKLAGVMAEGAHQPRQVLGADHDDRHHGDDQKLRPTDVEHGRDFRPMRDRAKQPRAARHRLRLARFLLARGLGAGGGLCAAGSGGACLCSITLGSAAGRLCRLPRPRPCPS